MLWVLKRASKQILKLMGKKIFPILLSKYVSISGPNIIIIVVIIIIIIVIVIVIIIIIIIINYGLIFHIHVSSLFTLISKPCLLHLPLLSDSDM